VLKPEPPNFEAWKDAIIASSAATLHAARQLRGRGSGLAERPARLTPVF
jgi:hypothetical protein